MRNRKRSILTHLVCFVTAISLIMGLAGCSGKSSPSDTVQPDTTKPSNADQPNTPNSLSEMDFVSGDEEVVITFSNDEYAYSQFKPLMEAFHEENPSITVQFVSLDSTNYGESTTVEGRLLALASSADTSLTSIRAAGMSGYFLDLQPLIDMDSSFDREDFWPGSLSALEDNEGRVLGLPMTLFMRGIFYDKAAFETANLSYPQPGWTWEDFRSATAALAQVQDGDIRYGYADRFSASILQPLIGYDLALNDGVIDAEALAANLDWYVQMAREDQIMGMKKSDDFWGGLFKYWALPAMWYGSLYEFVLGSVTGEDEATDLTAFFTESAYGFTPFPVDSDGENGNTTPVSALCGVISAGSEHPIESWKWLNFLTEHWLVSDIGVAGNQLHIPARQSVAEAEGFWDNYPVDVQEAMRYGLEHAYFSSLYSRAEGAVLDVVRDTVDGRTADLAGALEDAETAQASWQEDPIFVPEIVVAAPQPTENIPLDAATINFYHDRYEAKEKAAITALVNQFNRDHQDEISVKVKNTYTYVEGTGFYQSMTNQFDCFLSQLDPQGAVSSGVILDLTALMEAEDAAFQGDFNPLLLDAAKFNEGFYALPLFNQPAIIVYNADLLAERGLEPPSLDWTFDEFLELITAVTSTSVKEKVYGFLPDSHLVNTIEMFYAGRGVQWRDTSGNFPVVKLDTPEMADALAWLNELKQSGILFQAASGNDWWPSMERAVRSGQIGFWTVDAGEQETEYIDGSGPAIKIGIAPLPYTAKPNGAYDSSYVTGFYISNTSENPEACWELAKYFSEGLDVLEGVPARISLANSPEWEANVGVENAEVYRAAVASNLEDAEVDPYGVFFWGPINNWLFFAERNIENGNDPAQELAIAQQYSDAYLDCMASYDILSLNNDALIEIVQLCATQVDVSN
jgi:multiple sugar transport system substrate-binding protein